MVLAWGLCDRRLVIRSKVEGSGPPCWLHGKETRVRSLGQEDPIRCAATKPVYYIH